MKKHNFYAGPSILSQYAIDGTIEAIRDFANMGLSILEISHRSKQFQAVMDKAQALFKELLDIPEGYEVLFLGGGASTQFAMVPYNLLKTKAAYLDTGTWAHKAIKEAKLFGEVNVLASSEQDNYVYYPTEFEVPTDVDYLHITTNNTVYGTELRRDLDVPVRMVADMSSDIFTRPIDVSKYDLIYGGAQKNLAPAGVTFVIVKVDALGKVDRAIPTMLNYETHVKKGSMFNTPPVLPIYTAMKTLEWYKELGGVKALQEIDEEKARVLYDAIDSSRMFAGTVHPDSRSIMNVCFVMKPEYKELEQEFIDFAGTKGIIGIKGHRSVGGFRASLYNALPLDSVKVLTAAMKEFENNH
ncbi:MAG: 3-phosphoserine/phosphohydroxythreonine transaminase [Muribaculaceae bacterium]|nr:3-phosphoserine/phosphohydroxythreonine transaminase [Muribaculaceae bacterium]